MMRGTTKLQYLVLRNISVELTFDAIQKSISLEGGNVTIIVF